MKKERIKATEKDKKKSVSKEEAKTEIREWENDQKKDEGADNEQGVEKMDIGVEDVEKDEKVEWGLRMWKRLRIMMRRMRMRRLVIRKK